MTFEPFTNICGEFKIIAGCGYEEFFAAVGIPEELGTKMINEHDARITIEEKDGFYRSKYISQYMPMDVCFKMDEEYTINYPGVPGTYKV